MRIAPEDLRPMREAASDYSATEQLKEHLRQRRSERRPFYLEHEEFDRICRWKLRGQYARLEKALRASSAEVIRNVTEAAFRLFHEIERYELELRFGVLTSLRGVGIGVASAILALCYPADYVVIDYRGWRQAFGEEKGGFAVGDYQRYLSAVVQLSVQLGWYPQETDLAIWALDVERDGIPLPPPEPREGPINLDADPFNADWLRFRALDGMTPEQFVKQFGHLSVREFKCLPVYHMNKQRNPWVRDLEWEQRASPGR